MKLKILFLFLAGIINCVAFAQQTVPSLDSIATDDLSRAMESIMDANVDEEEAIEILSKYYPELLNPVVDAGKDYDRANQVDNAKINGIYYQNLGRKMLQQKKFDKAIIYLQKAITKETKALKGVQRHPGLSSLNKDLGKAYEGKENYQEALIFYQRGVISNSTDFGDVDLLTNPKIKDIISPTIALPIFEAKADLLYRSSSNENKLLAALIAYERAIEVLEIINKKYQEDSELLFLGDKAVELSEKAIAVAIKLYQLTGNKAYKDRLFSISEKGKAMVLLSALQKANANNKTVPERIVRREQALKIKIGRYRDLLKNGTGDKSEIEDKLFKANEALFFLQDSLSDLFPKYTELKDSYQKLSVDSLQEYLRNQNAALVAYFLGQNSSYAFVLDGEETHIENIQSLDQIEELVLSLRKNIQAQTFKNDAQQAWQSFVRDAGLLYRLVGEEPISNIPNEIEEIVVIPDGVLWLLPFELLLKGEANDASVDFGRGNLPYLLNDFAITYSYSARVLMHQQKQDQQEASIPFLGFAPAFTGEEIASRSCSEGEANGALQFNQQELEEIDQYFEGLSFFDESADKATFVEHIADANIIHLSTHACLNSKDPMESRIFFSGDDYLKTSEIYDLTIQAKMAVLSACQTGLGKIQKGEGMLSLARAFTYAGCPSVTMSLWPVADGSTAEIMTLYYKFLNQGESKSKALRQAKLEYMDQQDKAKQHPYYWAAFVHIGDTALLGNPQKSSILYYLAGIGALFLLFMVMKAGRKTT